MNALYFQLQLKGNYLNFRQVLSQYGYLVVSVQ